MYYIHTVHKATIRTSVTISDLHPLSAFKVLCLPYRSFLPTPPTAPTAPCTGPVPVPVGWSSPGCLSRDDCPPLPEFWFLVIDSCGQGTEPTSILFLRVSWAFRIIYLISQLED